MGAILRPSVSPGRIRLMALNKLIHFIILKYSIPQLPCRVILLETQCEGRIDCAVRLSHLTSSVALQEFHEEHIQRLPRCLMQRANARAHHLAACG